MIAPDAPLYTLYRSKDDYYCCFNIQHRNDVRLKVCMQKSEIICLWYFCLLTCSFLLLYLLNLDNSKPQLCPIQPPFLLTKLIKDGSTCTQSSSYISECANDYQFRLHLTPCLSSHQAIDLQLVCVATWIEGFHTYFVTRILSKHHHHQYACFVS
jgi:hypothetical protein